MKKVKDARPFRSSPSFATQSLISMSENTQDSDMSSYKEAILALLRVADERMLHDSSNPVYLKMKSELEHLRWVTRCASLRARIYDPCARSAQSEDHSGGQCTSPCRLQDIPILGVRIRRDGTRLVFRAKPPSGNQVCDPTLVCELRWWCIIFSRWYPSIRIWTETNGRIMQTRR